MSSLSKQPLKVLITIVESLFDSDFNYKDPYDTPDTNMTILRTTSNWLGGDFDIEDMEYISAFITLNEKVIKQLYKGEISKSEISQHIEFPKLKNYKVSYEVWGPAVLTEQYKKTWSTYDKSWVNDSFRYAYNNGDVDYWEGEYQGMETDNFEPDNFDITYSDLIQESKKPVLSKLVLENTKDVLDNLDKDTLIELRNLINQKLSSS